MYFSVPFIFYMVYKPTSSFTVYKALFALIAVLIVRGVVSTVSKVVLLVSKVVLLVSKVVLLVSIK